MNIAISPTKTIDFSFRRINADRIVFETENGDMSFAVDFEDLDVSFSDVVNLELPQLLGLNPDLAKTIKSKFLEDAADGVESGDEGATDSEPFDTSKISIDAKTTALDSIIRRLKQQTFVLHPNFQRNEIWTPEQKSKLIESILLKIPIPMFYVSSDKNSVWTVVDGLQRMSAIRDFILGKNYHPVNNKNAEPMHLIGLEFLTQYTGSTFDELPVNMQNRIYETEFLFTIVNPGTPEEVKRNIFKRLNTGGVPLSEQEIRNALYEGASTELLSKLVKKESFLCTVGRSISDSRMEAQDMALRAVSFIIKDYTGFAQEDNVDKWLSNAMMALNLLEASELQKISNQFDLGVKRSVEIFGEHAFRKSFEGERKSPINKTLLEMWVSLLGKMEQERFCKLQQLKVDFIEQYKALLEEADFSRAVSRDGMIKRAIELRYSKIIKLLNKYTSND